MTAVATLLAGIRERAEAATLGPWTASDFGHPGQDEPSSIIIHHGAFKWTAINDGEYVAAMPAWDSQEGADAAFIAAARTDVPRLVAALEAVEDLAKVWNAKGEHDMAYSKTIPDEDIAMELLTHGADMVEKARIIRAAVVTALGEGK